MIYSSRRVCDYVVEGEQRLQVQVELSDVVTGSVVGREVIAINDGSKMIFLFRSISDTAEKRLHVN